MAGGILERRHLPSPLLLFASESLPLPPPPLAGKRNLTASAGRLRFRDRRLSCRDNMLISQPAMLINGRRRNVDLETDGYEDRR